MPKIERRNSALGGSSTVPDNEARNRKNGKLPIRLNTIPLRATTGYGNGKAQGRTSPRSPYQLKSMEVARHVVKSVAPYSWERGYGGLNDFESQLSSVEFGKSYNKRKAAHKKKRGVSGLLALAHLDKARN